MGDRYRRQRDGYLPIAVSLELPTHRPADPERVQTLLAVARRLLAEPKSTPGNLDRRHASRQPFPTTCLLTPCDKQGKILAEETTPAAAKDLSTKSVSLLHTRSLPEGSRFILSLERPNDELFSLLVEVTRSAPIGQGIYLIGGEFRQRIDWGGNDGGDPRPGASPFRS